MSEYPTKSWWNVFYLFILGSLIDILGVPYWGEFVMGLVPKSGDNQGIFVGGLYVIRACLRPVFGDLLLQPGVIHQLIGTCK